MSPQGRVIVGCVELPAALPRRGLAEGGHVFAWAHSTCPPPRWGRVWVGVSFPHQGGRELTSPYQPREGEGRRLRPPHKSGAEHYGGGEGGGGERKEPGPPPPAPPGPSP